MFGAIRKCSKNARVLEISLVFMLTNLYNANIKVSSCLLKGSRKYVFSKKKKKGVKNTKKSYA